MIKKIGLILSLVIFLVACKKEDAVNKNKIEEIRKNVKVVDVKKDKIADTYVSDSIIVPKEKVDHTIDADGKVKNIHKKNGDIVKKGEIIVELTDPTTEANYFSTKAGLAAAKAAFDVAKNNYEKYQILYKKDLVSQLEYLEYKNRFTEAQGKYLAQKAEMEDAQDKYFKLTRRAEIDGVVGNLYLKLGNKVKAKETLFTVVDDRDVEVYVDFPGKWYSRLKPGNIAYIEIPDLDGKEFKGFISEINPVANTETRKFSVKLTIPNPNLEIKDGMYAQARIPAGVREAIVVPQEAVFIRDLIHYAFIAKDGVAKRVQVETGAIEEPNIEIISSSILPGDEIIIEGLFGLTDGDKLNIIK
jgi:RND family efflux transporter MFP subunit